MNGHVDVNLLLGDRHLAGAALVVLFHELQSAGYKPRYKRKEVGGHICLNWIYVQFGDYETSTVVFGSTLHDTRNPVPHMYVRGKAKWIGQGHRFLDNFVKNKLSQFGTQPVLHGFIRATFCGGPYGVEYLDATAGARIKKLPLPHGVYADGEGWAFVERVADRRTGWVPDNWLAL